MKQSAVERHMGGASPQAGCGSCAKETRTSGSWCFSKSTDSVFLEGHAGNTLILQLVFVFFGGVGWLQAGERVRGWKIT
jgi:hypothetical protein